MDPNNQAPAPAPIPTQDYTTNNYKGPSSLKSRVLVVAMILGILILVITLFLVINSRKDPAAGSVEQVAAVNVEIQRVSDIAIQSDLLSDKGLDLASTARLLAVSHQTLANTVITEKFGSKLSKDILASSFDSANDDLLKQGELLDRMDSSYGELLKDLLITANARIQEASDATNSQEVEAQLRTMSESNETLFNSIR